MPTIGLVCNLYNECNALPGWLELHLPFFDDVRVYHAGPGGAYSNDGTIEILEKWKVPVLFGDIGEGFGTVRTKAIRFSPCDWVMILDADERFYPLHRLLTCKGESTPHSEVDAILQTYDFHDLKTMLPNWENVARLGANLRVEAITPMNVDPMYNQGAHLRSIISDQALDSVAVVRRHWHDFTFSRPTQNWLIDPDPQMRLVRNRNYIYFDPSTRMHERLVGVQNTFQMRRVYGPFFDHMHLFFKKMEVEQRAHDIAIYDKIHAGEKPPTWEEFKSKL